MYIYLSSLRFFSKHIYLKRKYKLKTTEDITYTRRGRKTTKKKSWWRVFEKNTHTFSLTKLNVWKMTFYKTEYLSSWRETKSDLSMFFTLIIQFCPPNFNSTLQWDLLRLLHLQHLLQVLSVLDHQRHRLFCCVDQPPTSQQRQFKVTKSTKSYRWPPPLPPRRQQIRMWWLPRIPICIRIITNS